MRTIKDLLKLGTDYASMTADEIELLIKYKAQLRTDRTIEELLNAGTYQDMTDDEIQRVIDYKVDDQVAKAKASEEYAAYISSINEYYDAVDKRAEQARYFARNMITSFAPKLKRVTDMEDADGAE